MPSAPTQQPRGVSIPTVNQTCVEVKWTGAPNNGNGPITKYEVSYIDQLYITAWESCTKIRWNHFPMVHISWHQTFKKQSQRIWATKYILNFFQPNVWSWCSVDNEELSWFGINLMVSLQDITQDSFAIWQKSDILQNLKFAISTWRVLLSYIDLLRNALLKIAPSGTYRIIVEFPGFSVSA